MKFSGKKEFKEAIIQYCLNERKVVKYVKDEPELGQHVIGNTVLGYVCIQRIPEQTVGR